MVNTPKTIKVASNSWGIQVGAFKNERTARAAIKKAYNIAGDGVKNAYVNIASTNDNGGVHRARLGNLSKQQAQNACTKLQSANQSCFALRIN